VEQDNLTTGSDEAGAILLAAGRIGRVAVAATAG